MLASFEPRVEDAETTLELRRGVIGRRLASVLRLERDRRVPAVVQVLQQARSELDHRPDGIAERVGARLPAAAGPQPLACAVFFAEVDHDRARFEQADVAIDERRDLAAWIDREVARGALLAVG